MKEIEKKITIISRRIIKDDRGWFLKAIDGNEPLNHFPCEVYITSAKPGQSKGGHYHKTANEWFTLIKGEAILILEDVMTKEKKQIKLTSLDSKTVFVPPYVAHSFLNNGNEDYLLLAYTDQKYDSDDTIDYKL